MGIHIGILTNGRFSIREIFPDTTNPPNVEIAYFYGQIVDANGNPAPNVRVSFSVACAPQCYEETVAITAAPVSVYTNSAGMFEVELIKGIPYKATIHDVGLYMVFTVPSAANIVNLIELLHCDEQHAGGCGPCS